MSGETDRSRRWMDHSTELFLTAVADLEDDAWDTPLSLPGWRPREVVAHVHLNAGGLRNLVTWATTGVETPMYLNMQQRDVDIEQTAKFSPRRLRELVHQSAQELAEDLDLMSNEAWEHAVVTGQGRTVPATEILWMRTREVAIHAIDLGTGVRFEDLDGDLVKALVHDVVALRLRRAEGPTLAAWLTGRSHAGSELGRWI